MKLSTEVRDRIVIDLYQRGRVMEEIVEIALLKSPKDVEAILKTHQIPDRTNRSDCEGLARVLSVYMKWQTPLDEIACLLGIHKQDLQDLYNGIWKS